MIWCTFDFSVWYLTKEDIEHYNEIMEQIKMNKEHNEYLTKTYPYLFADRYGDMRNTAMCWGFECGDGWFQIIKEAAEKLEPLIKKDAEKNAKLEKPWYKHIRNIIGFTANSAYIFGILYKFVSWLQPNIYSNPIVWYGGHPRASQVKEKFGTLHFYLSHGTEAMHAIVDKAQSQSSKTCEECGKPGKLRGRGWVYTACSKHIRKPV